MVGLQQRITYRYISFYLLNISMYCFVKNKRIKSLKNNISISRITTILNMSASKSWPMSQITQQSNSFQFNDFQWFWVNKWMLINTNNFFNLIRNFIVISFMILNTILGHIELSRIWWLQILNQRPTSSLISESGI